MRVWRLTKTKHAGSAFSGDGARLYPGRWHPRGLPVVYTADSRALAVLELLVHLDPDDLSDFAIIGADVPEDLLEVVNADDLDPDWQSKPEVLRDFGASWAKSLRSLGLRVPSAVIPGESNVVLNPLHGEFARLSVGVANPFSLDPRLRR
jgi:RES domain-containing protein